MIDPDILSSEITVGLVPVGINNWLATATARINKSSALRAVALFAPSPPDRWRIGFFHFASARSQTTRGRGRQTLQLRC